VTRRFDAVIVGGGPAGSTCARTLTAAGADVLVLDRATFPRDKICAGWITPAVVRHLELDLDAYRATGLTLQAFRGFRTGVVDGRMIDTRYDAPISYGIRRCEFDNYLLARCGASVRQGTPLRSLERRNGSWLVNGDIETPLVVGAGGHFCPVAQRFRAPHRDGDLVVAQEAELPLTNPEACTVDAAVPQLYFCRDLDGYGWCVRKGNYLNVGIGRRDPREFPAAVRTFAQWLEREGHAPVDTARARWRGHAYLLAGATPTPPAGDGWLLVGDAAGLAFRESGEGIGPAIESAVLAAATVLGAGGRTDAAALQPYVDAIAARTRRATRGPRLPRAIAAPLGRALLASTAFTRHVVMDRWFLRRA
jgi:flavin-dependent dehydrogenase